MEKHAPGCDLAFHCCQASGETISDCCQESEISSNHVNSTSASVSPGATMPIEAVSRPLAGNLVDQVSTVLPSQK
jgi:hypothetical protein